MIVLTILALLTAAGMPQYVNYLQRAAVTETVSVLAHYKKSLGLFWSIEQRLPTSGDVLPGTPVDLPFGTVVTVDEDSSLPTTIESLELSASGDGVLITAVVQGNVFSTVAVNNRTIVLGAKPSGMQLLFECGNFSVDAEEITDIGFTNKAILPKGCNYDGVSTWLNAT